MQSLHLTMGAWLWIHIRLTNLRCTAHAVLALAGPHQKQVTMLVTLVIDGAGQADFARVCRDGEQTAGIDEEAVADWFLLEGHSRCHQKPGETEGERELVIYSCKEIFIEQNINKYSNNQWTVGPQWHTAARSQTYTSRNILLKKYLLEQYSKYIQFNSEILYPKEKLKVVITSIIQVSFKSYGWWWCGQEGSPVSQQVWRRLQLKTLLTVTWPWWHANSNRDETPQCHFLHDIISCWQSLLIELIRFCCSFFNLYLVAWLGIWAERRWSQEYDIYPLWSLEDMAWNSSFPFCFFLLLWIYETSLSTSLGEEP